MLKLGRYQPQKIHSSHLKKLTRTSGARNLRKNHFVVLEKLVVLAVENLNDHETLVKENIIPANDLKKKAANDKTYIVSLRKRKGF